MSRTSRQKLFFAALNRNMAGLRGIGEGAKVTQKLVQDSQAAAGPPPKGDSQARRALSKAEPGAVLPFALIPTGLGKQNAHPVPCPLHPA